MFFMEPNVFLICLTSGGDKVFYTARVWGGLEERGFRCWAGDLRASEIPLSAMQGHRFVRRLASMGAPACGEWWVWGPRVCDWEGVWRQPTYGAGGVEIGPSARTTTRTSKAIHRKTKRLSGMAASQVPWNQAHSSNKHLMQNRARMPFGHQSAYACTYSSTLDLCA